MTYLFILALWWFGLCIHMLQKIAQLRKRFPEFKPRMVIYTFFGEEWDSLLVSCVVICVYLLFMFILKMNGQVFWSWFAMYGQFGLALVLGYAGQALAYKYLNTATERLMEKADELKNKKP